MTFDFIPIIDELIADMFIFYLLLDLSCKATGSCVATKTTRQKTGSKYNYSLFGEWAKERIKHTQRNK